MHYKYINKRTMMALYHSPELTEFLLLLNIEFLHNYDYHNHVDCFKIFCVNFMIFKSDMMVLYKRSSGIGHNFIPGL